MTIHSQSDYGYSIPQIEHRNRAECLRRATLCDGLAAKHNALSIEAKKYREWAIDWRNEAETASVD